MYIRPVVSRTSVGSRTQSERPFALIGRDALAHRLELYATVQALNTELLASSSATLTLESWCLRHGLGRERLAARFPGIPAAAATVEQRQTLGAEADEPVRYRRVQLACADLVLSEADNWYRPARLTEDMNRQLDGSPVPFGRVVRPLKPRRRTEHVRMLWQPLPENWTALPRSALVGLSAPDSLVYDPEQPLFEHQVTVLAGDDQPIALVREVYKMSLIAFRFTAPER